MYQREREGEGTLKDTTLYTEEENNNCFRDEGGGGGDLINTREMATDTDTVVGNGVGQSGDSNYGCNWKIPGNGIIIIVLHYCTPPCP